MNVANAICKLLTVVSEAQLEDELVHELTAQGARGYTISDARGSGARGVRDSSWSQGANIRVEVLCDEPTAERIVKRLRERFYADYAMVLFVHDVAVLRPEKFSP